MSDFIRVPRAFKKRSKRSVLVVPGATTDGVPCVSGSGAEGVADMGRRSFKEKKSFKKGSVKERWLLTRKTWKFMQDAGRRLLPEGVGNRPEDIPKIEKYFQEVCRSEPRFLLWRRKCSYPGANGPLPSRRRRWRRRVGTVSPKKASSADEAEDDYFETLEQQQYEQLMIDMLKNYLDIRDDEEENLSGHATIPRPLGVTTTTSMLSLHSPTSPTTTTACIDPEGGWEHRRGQFRSNRKGTHDSASDVHGSAQGTTHQSPFSLFMSSRDSVPAHLMANMRRYTRGSASSLMDQITPEMLNDKAALRRLYDQLQANRRLHTIGPNSTYRIPNPKPYYQRSTLGLHKTFAFPELTGKAPRSMPQTTGGFGHSPLRHVDPGANRSGSALSGIDESRSLDDSGPPVRPQRRQMFATEGIQTDRLSLPVLTELAADYKRALEHEEALAREEEAALHLDPSHTAARNNDRRNSEDVSQSVSDTIKRYLRMARKKPPKDDVNRFKRINYDQNLRNIKAKGETTKISDDDDTCKGCQTDADWIVKSFAVLSKDAPAQEPAVRPTTLPRPKSTSSAGTTTPISSPTSPGGISANLFHTSTQFLSSLFGHTHVEGCSSNDSIYSSADAAANAMQKSKSSSNVGHLVSRKIWKSRSKSQNRPAAISRWTPQGNCTWVSTEGHVIKLRDTTLSDLTEVERKILCQLAIAEINQMNLGVNTENLLENIANSQGSQKPAKRKALLLKRKALTTGFFDSSKDDSKTTRSSGRVFGIPLEQSVENELKERERSASTKLDRRARNSLSSLMDPNPRDYRCSGSCESLPSKTRPVSEQELLKGSLSQFDVRRNSHDADEEDVFKIENRPQVPALVVMCIRHLEKFGLHTVGIFRKSTSKKRVRQLREDFDQGTSLTLDEDVCPHDVATLLKEYLRDLPEPLLCRKLYQMFVNTMKIRNRKYQLDTLSCLVQLLPVSHRDTLHYLLGFLAKVARFADDVKSSSGEVISEGNKMDSNNLATVFAPNILHDSAPGQLTTDQQVGERLDVINVVRFMIDHYDKLFNLSAKMLDVVYQNMIDTHPLQLDVLCDRLDQQSNKYDSDASSQLSPTSPPPQQTTAQLLEANKQKRLYAREEFLHHNSSMSKEGQSKGGGGGGSSRRSARDASGPGPVSRSGSVDEDAFEGYSRSRRMSSPFSSANVISASLKIPVQMLGDEQIPYIEDSVDCSSSTTSSRRGHSSQVPQIDSRKSSSSGTITGTLSLVQSPTSSNATSPDYRAVGQQIFFGDDNFKERLLESQARASPKTPSEKAAPGSELRKSTSLFTVGAHNKKLFDTKAPTKQKLSIHPSSLMSSGAGGTHHKGVAGEHKMTAISNIGGDLLRSKTADFERFLVGQNNSSSSGSRQQEQRTYKRKEIISSAHNSKN